MIKKNSTLTLLCAAVAAYYQNEGDKTKAGVAIACLDNDPEHFYASVARYPTGPYDKQIVCSTHTKLVASHDTAEKAVEELARRGQKMVKAPPVKSTLDALTAHLEK